MADYIPMSVRCFAPPDDWTPTMRELPEERWQDTYQLALVYDTETTTDRLQGAAGRHLSALSYRLDIGGPTRGPRWKRASSFRTTSEDRSETRIAERSAV